MFHAEGLQSWNDLRISLLSGTFRAVQRHGTQPCVFGIHHSIYAKNIRYLLV